MTASKSLRQANRNLLSALKQPSDLANGSDTESSVDCCKPSVQASPMYPRLDRMTPGMDLAMIALASFVSWVSVSLCVLLTMMISQAVLAHDRT